MTSLPALSSAFFLHAPGVLFLLFSYMLPEFFLKFLLLRRELQNIVKLDIVFIDKSGKTFSAYNFAYCTLRIGHRGRAIKKQLYQALCLAQVKLFIIFRYIFVKIFIFICKIFPVLIFNSFVCFKSRSFEFIIFKFIICQFSKYSFYIFKII